MKIIPATMRHLRTSITTMLLVLLSAAVLAGQASAAVYDFAGVGTASGGFKPQGNLFLVSDKFENDEPPNQTAIWYNNLGATNLKTVNGMIIKADGTNLTSFNLIDMKFTMYPSGETEDISILKITGTKVGGGTVTVTVDPPSTAPGGSFTLTGLPSPPDLSGFTNITQLSFDITTSGSVYDIDFSTITLANEVYPTIDPPTTQATNAQAVVIGSTELILGWTNGNGGSRVVFANQGTTSGGPTVTNGTTYAANSVFTSATDIGGGWKCVFNGNGSFAPVSGLTASTQYRFVVFEYNGSSGNEKYLTIVAGNASNQSTIGSLGDWTRGDIAGLDGTQNFWTWTDADRDANGNIYVGHKYNYYNDTNAQFRIEKWNGSGWSNPTSFTAQSAGYTGFSDHSGITVAGTDQLRLVLCGSQSGSGTMTEAKYNGSAWSFSNADTTSITNTSLNDPVIAVDGNGKSHILYEYSDAVNRYQYIKLASWSGTAWTNQTLSTIANDNDADNGVQNDYLLLNDASNKQHVFYIRMTTTGRDLHHWTNSTSPATDTTIFTGNTNSPYKLYGAIDSGGKFHIAYGEDALLGRKVMYLTDKSGSWVSQLLLISTAGWQKGFAPLELRINGNGDMVIPVRSNTDKVFKALLKQGSNPWKISALSPVDALTDDWEDAGFSYNTTGAVFRDDGKVMIAFGNGLSARPRRLMYTSVSLYTNTAPAVSVNTGLSVSQSAGATTITSAMLQATDPEQGAAALTFTLGAAPTRGTLKKSGGALGVSGAFTQDDVNNNLITYTPDGTVGADSFAFTVNDGAGGSTGSTTFSITVTDGVAPTLVSTARTDNTHITVTLSENCLNLTKANDGGFTVAETGAPGTTYAVSAIAQGTDASHVILTVANMGISGKEGVTVKYTAGGNGTVQDIAGNAMATNGTGVSVAAWDTTAPTISSGTLAASNGYLDIAFNEGAYGASNGVTPLSAVKLALIFTQNGGNATNAVISSVKKNDSAVEGSASALTGGETTIRVFLSITGIPSGVETIEIKPANGTSVYDQAGNAMSAAQTTGVKTLNDKLAPTISSGTLAADNSYIDITISEGIYGAGDGTTALSAANLALTFAANFGSTSEAFIFSVKKDDNTDEALATPLSGGETTVRVFLATLGIPVGLETIEIKPVSGAAVFDRAGNAMSALQTSGVKTLNNMVSPTASVILVNPDTPTALYAGVDGAGIYRSSDNGLNWSDITTQPVNKRIKGLVMHPTVHTTLYAASYGGGVYKSTDSGDTWSACGTTGLTDLYGFTLAIDPTGMLYVGTKGGIFASSDCITWNAVNSGLTIDPATPPMAIAIGPGTTLYAGLAGAGVFMSSNSGATWTAATTQPTNLQVRGLVIQPGDATKLYLATYGNGVFKSTDSGASWTICGNSGLTNAKVLSLVMDAAGRLYAGTYGGVFVSSDACATWNAINSGLP